MNATGDLTVNANSVVLLAGQAQAQADSVMTNSDSDMFSSTTTVTRQSQSSAKAQLNQLAGNNVSIHANQDVVSVGSKFAANDQLTVQGNNSQSFYAAKDTSQSSKSVESSSSLFGGMISLGHSSSTDTQAQAISIGSELTSTNAINIKVGNSATLEGATLRANNIAFIKTESGKAGQVNLIGSTDTTQTSHTEKSDTLGVYQSQAGSGETTQTLNLNQLNGKVSFDKDLQVAVQVPKTITTSGETANTAAASNASNPASQAQIQTQIDQLSQQPGLGYLSQLSSNAATANPTLWSQVQLAHDNWSYSQQGLTPAGAALLSIAVAAYAPGLSSGITNSITSVAGASTAAALNAGFVALQAQAAVAMVNNGGDIGKTLSQLGSSDSIKGLLTTMVTAGALNSLDQALGFTNSTQSVTGQTGAGSLGVNGVATSQAANQFGQNLLKNITNNVAGAAIDAAISGKPFNADSLSKALANALITAGMAAGANAIGDAATAQNGQPAQIDAFTQKLAHAILGCAGGAAIAGNSSGCSAGAVGAVVGELTAEYAKDAQLSDANALALAKVISAAAGVLVGGGGDNVAAVNVAATAGANAAENNYLSPKNNLKRNLAQDACAKDPSSQACNTAAQLNAIDQRTDEALAKVAAACTPNNLAACQDLVRTVNQLSEAGKAELRAMMNSLQPSCTPPRDCTQAANWTNNELKGLQGMVDAVWRTNASGQLEQTVGPEGVLAGGALAALRLSALGFTAGAGFDAVGQYVQNGAVRWEQTLVAGITAGVGTPLAARGKLWIPGAAATASAINTAFNNVYYDERTNVWLAAGLGAGAAAIAPSVGRWVSNSATPWLTQTPRIPVTGPNPTFPVQGRWPTLPSQVKTGVETTVGNVPSFIPLDNGKQETK